MKKSPEKKIEEADQKAKIVGVILIIILAIGIFVAGICYGEYRLQPKIENMAGHLEKLEKENHQIIEQRDRAVEEKNMILQKVQLITEEFDLLKNMFIDFVVAEVREPALEQIKFVQKMGQIKEIKLDVFYCSECKDDHLKWTGKVGSGDLLWETEKFLTLSDPKSNQPFFSVVFDSELMEVQTAVVFPKDYFIATSKEAAEKLGFESDMTDKGLPANIFKEIGYRWIKLYPFADGSGDDPWKNLFQNPEYTEKI